MTKCMVKKCKNLGEFFNPVLKLPVCEKHVDMVNELNKKVAIKKIELDHKLYKLVRNLPSE